MAANVKESETAVATTTTASTAPPASKSAEAVAGRPQPVALEIPVSINGARTVEGSDKREPFSENTKTVLVFGRGAVIRLASSVAPGQLVFLTNEKTKKEVVCQVVKSKNYRTVTGYVELEFTEPAVGFWGMRFPTDHIAPSSSTPGATAPRKLTVPPAQAQPKVVPAIPPAAAKSVAPAASVAPPIPAKPITVAPLVSIDPRMSGPAVIAAPPAKPELPNSTARLNTVPQTNPVVSAVVVPPAAPLPVVPAIVPSAPIAVTPGGVFATPQNQVTDSPKAGKSEASASSTAPSLGELKQQAARLQEQLGSMLFPKTPTEETSIPSPSEHALPTPPAVNAATKILELVHTDPKLPTQATEKTTTPAPKSIPISSALKVVPPSIAVEEVKIPSWLAPLSRETQSTVEVSSAETLADQEPASGDIENPEESFTAPVENSSRRPETAVFGGQLLGEASPEPASSESGSKKGLFIGIAAALLLVAGGAWYSRQPGNFISGLFESKPAPTQVANPGFAGPASKTESPATSTPDPTSFAASSSSVTTTALGSSEVVSNVSSAASKSIPMTSAPMSKDADSVSPNAPPIEETKRPGLGNVRLAKPVINRHSPSQAGIEAEPALEAHRIPGEGGVLPDLAAARRAEPAEPSAPLAVGGDVKQAQLIKSVSPVYPSAAKIQHVAGDVKIDALIDVDGNVSTMKILSGPSLLHQAALTAVKQWKYKPAQLDGKPTAMHLTVTVQFRFQQ